MALDDHKILYENLYDIFIFKSEFDMWITNLIKPRRSLTNLDSTHETDA
jgi:hypothetical protein